MIPGRATGKNPENTDEKNNQSFKTGRGTLRIHYYFFLPSFCFTELFGQLDGDISAELTGPVSLYSAKSSYFC